MTRVFAKESSAKILDSLESFFLRVPEINVKAEYNSRHSEFCDWFTSNVMTAEKKCKNGTVIQSRRCSYGQAAKVLDVAAKVYIYYCSQPCPEVAHRLIPMLHAALDTDMMYELSRQSAESLLGVDRTEYERLQKLVMAAIGESEIHPVQYDDVMWRRIQRSSLGVPRTP